MDVSNDFLLYMFNKALPCVLINPCVYGTCTNDNFGGYTCTCLTGYTGTNCQYGIVIFRKNEIK